MKEPFERLCLLAVLLNALRDERPASVNLLSILLRPNILPPSSKTDLLDE
jgi:hypothetical protein